jgi:hypothetical protein
MTITTGEELPDGGMADQNYVWLSQWQLENLNSNYVRPIDLEYYRQLTTPIAKALVPLFSQWFYAASRRPVQKRHRELCKLLNISVPTAVSKATEKRVAAEVPVQRSCREKSGTASAAIVTPFRQVPSTIKEIWAVYMYIYLYVYNYR